eukprot:5208375-Alexandrium_andersonii.AAC.1
MFMRRAGGDGRATGTLQAPLGCKHRCARSSKAHMRARRVRVNSNRARNVALSTNTQECGGPEAVGTGQSAGASPVLG